MSADIRRDARRFMIEDATAFDRDLRRREVEAMERTAAALEAAKAQAGCAT